MTPRFRALAAAIAISPGLTAPALAQTIPDILAPLAHTVVAVLDLPDHPHLLLIADEGEIIGYRLVSLGDEYRAGWIITAITAGGVTLQKDARVRTIAIVGQTPPPDPAPARRSPPVGKISMSNSVPGGSPAPSGD